MGNTFTDATSAGGGLVALASVEAVMARLQMPSATAAQQQTIESLLLALTPVVNARYGRDFMPRRVETMTANVSRYVVRLPGDLVSASAVTLHPESPVALAEGVGYELRRCALTGTATHIYLASDVSLCSTYAARFGHAQITVAGTWGVWGDSLDVSPDVAEAAVSTVAAWMERGASNVSGIDLSDPRGITPALVSAWDIPSSAHRKLSPYSVGDGVMGVW